jgi:uncharacterized protein (TIGR03663 family)
LLIAVVVALGLRLPHLSLRPLHADEANQAIKFGTLLEDGEYAYDPVDHHGPTLYYLSLPFAWLTGSRDLADLKISTLRALPVLAGVALVLLAGLFRTRQGRVASIGTGLLIALSPSMTFFSRYYIQEMLLILFTSATIGFLWQALTRKDQGWRWSLLTGFAAGLMHATKETSVLSFAAIAASLLILWFIDRKRDNHLFSHLRMVHLAAAGGVALVISVLFFSSFFTHLRGPLDSILTYFNAADRADGQGHEKPWWYYLKSMGFTRSVDGKIWGEGVVLLLGLVGLAHAFISRNRFALFWVMYTLMLTVVYSAIPYKNPWVMLSLAYGWMVLGGMGISVLVQGSTNKTLRILGTGLVLGGLIFQGSIAWRASHQVPYPWFERNPLVYTHPGSDLVKLTEQVEALAALHSDGTELRLAVIGPEPWPLPWYFREFNHVAYFPDLSGNAGRQASSAPIIICDARLSDALDEELEGDYSVSMRGLRPSVLLVLYVKRDLWESYMNTRSQNTSN